jgi:3,2-trans-enoyl-CoA isomerase
MDLKTIKLSTKNCGKGKGKYALVGIDNPPVNAITLQVWLDLTAVLEWAEAEGSGIRGILLYSLCRKDIFTAGNDLLELYAPKTTQERFSHFWITQTKFLSRLYRSPLVTVACLRGYAPAGGCAIAMCCDYRIITSTETVASTLIGLNEVRVGISCLVFYSKGGSWYSCAKVLGSALSSFSRVCWSC